MGVAGIALPFAGHAMRHGTIREVVKHEGYRRDLRECKVHSESVTWSVVASVNRLVQADTATQSRGRGTQNRVAMAPAVMEETLCAHSCGWLRCYRETPTARI